MIKTIQKYPFAKFKSNSRQEMYSKRAHSHKEVSLGYIESGETTITVSHQKYKLVRGDLVLIPAETVHLCVPGNLEDFKFQMIYFDTPWWNSNLDIHPGSFATLAMPATETIRALVKLIVEGKEETNTVEKMIIGSINEISTRFELQKSAVNKVEMNLERIHQQIKEMPQVSISIEEMADQLGLNKFSFIRKYAQRYGLTPHADIVNMRIQRSILLFESDMDLVSIALDCGFADQSHFINQFKLYTGLRPQEYRSSLAGQ